MNKSLEVLEANRLQAEVGLFNFCSGVQIPPDVDSLIPEAFVRKVSYHVFPFIHTLQCRINC